MQLLLCQVREYTIHRTAYRLSADGTTDSLVDWMTKLQNSATQHSDQPAIRDKFNRSAGTN